MRKATMVFESTSKAGVVQFMRGRVQEKNRRWGQEMTIGRSKFEAGKEYPVTTVLELMASGIRISIDPVQPERKVVIQSAAWKDSKIEAPNTEPVEDEAADNADKE